MASVTGGDMSLYINENDEILTKDNYNEVDALVFAELSYARYEDYFPQGSSNVSVNTFAAELAKHESNADKKAFLQSIAENPRYQNCVITNMAAENQASQWGALTISMDGSNKNVVIAMRGTDGTTFGWQEDFQLLYDMDGTEAQHLSAEYLKNCSSEKIFLTGHSKGGNDAIAAYVMNDRDVRDRVVQIYNYDGPGVNPDFKDLYNQGYSELNDKLKNYYPQDSIVGKLLIDNPGENIYIYADTEGHIEIPIFGEHDPFAFKISDGTFERVESSFLSDFCNVSIDGAMHNLSSEERKNVYTVLSALGVPALIAGKSEETPYAIFDRNPGWVPGIITSVEKMELGFFIYENCSAEEKRAMEKMLLSFFGTAVAYSSYKLYETYKSVKSDVSKYIENAYGKLISWVDSVKTDIADKIQQFSFNLVNKAEDFFGGFEQFVEEIKQKISVSNIQNADGDMEPLAVRTNMLQNNSERMVQLSKRLDKYCNEVRSIQSRLKLVEGVLSTISFFSITNSLEHLSKVSADCSSAIYSGMEQYNSSEIRICNLVK